MRIHEYQARELLAGFGVRFSPGATAKSPEEAEAIARELGGRVVVKAQIHSGGRGKAGGVKLGESPEETRTHAQAMLGSFIKGRKVRKILVAQTVSVEQEFYLGAVLDRARKRITLMASGMGGVDIEEVARTAPGKIAKITADPLLGMADYQARDLALAVGLNGSRMNAFAHVTQCLFRAFMEYDCSLLEINPLALDPDEQFVALDSKMIIDDNALWKQPVLAALRDVNEEEPAEIEAQEVGLSYVKLDGDIGCMVNGAGLAMATMDAIKLYGGQPANFLDVGGGASVRQVDAGLGIILKDASVHAVLINIFGGITRCDVVAQALLGRFEEGGVGVPIVARLVGTNAPEGRQMLVGAPVTLAATMAEAAEQVVYLAQHREEGPR